MAQERAATWECRVCPDDDQVLRRQPNYVCRDSAEDGLRLHFITEHGGLLWNPETRDLVAGDVIGFTPATR